MLVPQSDCHRELVSLISQKTAKQKPHLKCILRPFLPFLQELPSHSSREPISLSTPSWWRELGWDNRQQHRVLPHCLGHWPWLLKLLHPVQADSPFGAQNSGLSSVKTPGSVSLITSVTVFRWVEDNFGEGLYSQGGWAVSWGVGLLLGKLGASHSRSNLLIKIILLYTSWKSKAWLTQLLNCGPLS